MASHHREQKIIAAVTCPACGAERGTLCKRPHKGRTDINPYAGRMFICRERRVAWQMIRDGEIT